MDDNDLISQLRLGDESAFDILFNKYYKFLLATAYALLKNEEEAKDVVQSFFIDIWEKGTFYTLEGEVKSYFYRSINNRSLNLLRKKAIERERATQLMEVGQHEIEELESLEPKYRLIEYAMAEMSLQKRQAVNLVYLEQKKYAEAAAVMGISINSFKTHLKSAMKTLRTKLARV